MECARSDETVKGDAVRRSGGIEDREEDEDEEVVVTLLSTGVIFFHLDDTVLLVGVGEAFAEDKSSLTRCRCRQRSNAGTVRQADVSAI